MDLGFVVAAILTAMHLPGEPPLSTHQIAKKYGASPSQARNVFKWMRENDLIDCDAGGEVVNRAALSIACGAQTFILRQICAGPQQLFRFYALSRGQS